MKYFTQLINKLRLKGHFPNLLRRSCFISESKDDVLSAEKMSYGTLMSKLHHLEKHELFCHVINKQINKGGKNYG